VTIVPSTHFSFVTLKAFGDYVIAYSCIRGCAKFSTHVVGSHLRELAAAIDPEWRPIFLEHHEPSVPAAFDVKKRGLIAAATSIFGLRKAISQLPEDNILVFDRWTWRERLLAGRRSATYLPPADNIYLAYEQFITTHNLAPFPALRPQPEARPLPGSKVRIFASSRVDKKKMPIQLCEQLINACADRGQEAELVVLENEYPALEATRLPKIILPKSFTGMVDCIAESKRVISTDSLPAHIAEILGFRPVVVSPTDNSYWLPQSCFHTGAWSLFEDGASGVLDAINRAAG
jgi:ADP-heptose:LPS heptosyltransferase